MAEYNVTFTSVARRLGDFLGVTSAAATVQRSGGQWWYLNNNDPFGSTDQGQKLELILKNPAAFYCVSLLCDLFTLGRFHIEEEGADEPIKDAPILDLLNNPNPMQTGEQFKYDYFFWRLMGTAYLYSTSNVLAEGLQMPRLYFLEPHLIEWPKWYEKNRKRLFESDQIPAPDLVYDKQGQNERLPWADIMRFYDITNGIGSWWEGPSRIDALYKIIKNSDAALNSKHITAEFLGKFLVGSQNDIENVSSLGLTEADKQSVRSAMRSKESVYPTKTNPQIARFIEDSTAINALDEAFMTDAFLIGKVLNIPKDVLEMLGDSTYENQEKARAAIVSYCLQPAANDLCRGLAKKYGLPDNQKLVLYFDYLPFVQAFEKDRAEVMRDKASAFITLVKGGFFPEDAANFLEIPNTGLFQEANNEVNATE